MMLVLSKPEYNIQFFIESKLVSVGGQAGEAKEERKKESREGSTPRIEADSRLDLTTLRS